MLRSDEHRRVRPSALVGVRVQIRSAPPTPSLSPSLSPTLDDERVFLVEVFGVCNLALRMDARLQHTPCEPYDRVAHVRAFPLRFSQNHVASPSTFALLEAEQYICVHVIWPLPLLERLDSSSPSWPHTALPSFPSPSSCESQVASRMPEPCYRLFSE